MSMKGLAGHIRCVTTHRVDNKRLGQLRESGVPIVIMTGASLALCWSICRVISAPHNTGTVDPLVRPKNSYLLAQELNPAEFHVRNEPPLKKKGDCANTHSRSSGVGGCRARYKC